MLCGVAVVVSAVVLEPYARPADELVMVVALTRAPGISQTAPRMTADNNHHNQSGCNFEINNSNNNCTTITIITVVIFYLITCNRKSPTAIGKETVSRNADGAQRQCQRRAYSSQSGTEEPSHADSYALVLCKQVIVIIT